MRVTHYEDGRFYAVITLPSGHDYYSGPFNSRSAARRFALKENQRHRFAASCGMIYNTRGV